MGRETRGSIRYGRQNVNVIDNARPNASRWKFCDSSIDMIAAKHMLIIAIYVVLNVKRLNNRKHIFFLLPPVAA